MAPPKSHVSTDLSRHRSKIARVLLVGFAVLGLVAYIPSMWLAVRVGAWEIAVLDTVIYLAVVAVALFGGGRYWLQAGVVVAACYLLGVGLAVVLGPQGGGQLWLLVTPIVGAILFDRRGAFAVLGLVVLTTVIISALAFAGVMHWSQYPVTQPILWLVLSANALLLASASALAVITLIRGLQQEMVERQRAELQLRQSEKLQAIGTLATGIAHDFNNLLTPILSATELARSELPAESPLRVALDPAIDAALAGRELARRILAFSRPSVDGRMTLPAGAAFRDAIRLLRSTIPGSVRVDLHVDGDGSIPLSPAEVHQIVLNLGTNAHRAMPEGGSLSFRLDTLMAERPRGAEPRPLVRLEVTDTGRGMPADVAARIFEPFFTTDPTRGSGIGLSTVHGIVSSAGGTVTCRSEPGAGTSFTLLLPLVAPAAGAEGASVRPAPPPRPVPPSATVTPSLAVAPRHVLVVDDELAVREVAARVLQRSGYRATALAGGRAALDALREPGSEVVLVLTDLHMPDMNGLELARRVRAEHPAIAVVLMSGLAAEAATYAGTHDEDCVLGKPFRLDELRAAVETALAVRAAAA